jgi:glycosyltransferase involved in cell wall biosynthesis
VEFLQGANSIFGIMQPRMGSQANTAATQLEDLRDGAGDQATQAAPLVSIVIPCLNEAQSIAECVHRARSILDRNGYDGEVVVADNGSTDGSPEAAEAAGARVVREWQTGYGRAYLAGFAAASGRYIVMADADLTYDFDDVPRFVEQLEDGGDFVIGNRMKGIRRGAMPWHHRYIGNPVLTAVLNLFYRTGVRDAHCGMRAVRRDVLPRLDLRAEGMEFASEMVIRASKEHLDIRQIPIEYAPRAGESKLSSFRDGWRHLRFLLVHSPTYLFLIPGALMALLGVLIMFAVLGNVSVFGRPWQLHTMIAGTLVTVVGTQVLGLGLAARAYGVWYLGERDPWFTRMESRLRLEYGLLAGIATLLVGVGLLVFILAKWLGSGRGALAETRLALLAATLVIVGLQITFSSFLLSILGLRRSD